MKIPKGLFNNKELQALKERGLEFDFSKDYTIDEMCDFEDRIGDMVLDNGFDGEEPNDQCAFWEGIIDKYTGDWQE